MFRYHLKRALIVTLGASLMALLGCSNGLSGHDNDFECGSLEVKTSTVENSRALDGATITSANIKVSGYGMSDVSGNVNLASGENAGTGSATVRNIPTGQNRVVTIESNVTGAVIRALCDINSGNNEVTVNWDTTAAANIFYYLIKNENVDVSSIEKEYFDSYIPNVHASLVDAEKIAHDYKINNLGAANTYIMKHGTVYLTTKNVAGYKVQITDIASPIVNVTSNELTPSYLEAYPGKWKVKVFDSEGTLKETKDVSVRSEKWTYVQVDYGTGTDISNKTIIFVKASSAPHIWAWESDGGHALTALAGGVWNASSAATKMVAATSDYMADPSGWYMIDYTAYATGKVIQFKLNWTGEEITGAAGTFWYDSTATTTNPSPVTAGLVVNVENPPEPLAPTVEIFPADGEEISQGGSVTITVTNGNDVLTAATATINGHTVNLDNGTNTFNIADYGVTEQGASFTVTANVENSIGSASDSATITVSEVVQTKNTFTWDNVNCYFVLTDRFYNGDKNNDGSYGRVKTSDGVGSFHGGDIKGLTEKLDYFNDLGVNAIWISAPYEQMHGWTSGKNNGFAHYAFHGYYTLDWTFMDQSMGTIEEFRTFVNEAHKRGIRVVMDVVLNHTGYDNWQDMIDYGFGGFKDSYSRYNHTAFATDGKWTKGNGSTWGTNWDTQDGWFKWWAFWVRGFGDKSWPHDDGVGYWTPGGDVDNDPLHGSLADLPDVVTEKTANVNLPTFLKTKWNGGSNSVTGSSNAGELNNTSSRAYGNATGHSYKDYQLPTVSSVDWYNKSGDWRTDGKGAQTDYQIIWLSGWVREFGIDGFRCDTAKHVDVYRWGQLKEACEDALKKWRLDSTKADTAGAKEWKDKFWMVGEAWGHGSGTSDSYFSTGKFDSMINFSFQGSNNTFGSTSCGTIPQPTDNDGKNWINYANIGASTTDTDSNGNCNSTLSYLSSHDTGLLRHGNMKEVGTKFILLPAGIQIYYGDESWRPYAYNSCGDSDMMTRGDMNWGSNTDSVTHWGKLGKFRKFNPAVGAGSQTINGSTYIRKFTKTKLSGIEANTIAISLSSTTLSGLPYGAGTKVWNWYDGKSATVQGGSVTFSGSSASVNAPVLCSDRNPADYGVTF